MPISTTVIIGAGVIALTTALTLQHRHPSISIILIASELPTTTSPTADYASQWAGAHYRPIPTTSKQLADEKKMAMATADVMRRIARESPEARVQCMKGVEYLESPREENLRLKSGDAYAWEGDHFRVLGKDELPDGVKWGCEYDTWCLNVSVYCRWLLQKFQENGGRVLQHRLSNAKEAFKVAEGLVNVGKIEKVINCSGRNFDHDEKMKIIRGQTVLVRQQFDKTVTRQCADGSWSFLIPRPCGGGTIVGGTKEISDHEMTARSETRAVLLQQASRLFPDFVDRAEKFEVGQDNVGRRPWREGGMRIGVENLPDGKTVIHGYGAGGRGYELSWGAAAKIVDLAVGSQRLRSSL